MDLDDERRIGGVLVTVAKVALKQQLQVSVEIITIRSKRRMPQPNAVINLDRATTRSSLLRQLERYKEFSRIVETIEAWDYGVSGFESIGWTLAVVNRTLDGAG